MKREMNLKPLPQRFKEPLKKNPDFIISIDYEVFAYFGS